MWWNISPACWQFTAGGWELRQAVLVLRWFPDRGCVHCLARDAGVSQATGYRYLHEVITVLARQAPALGPGSRR